MESPFLAHLKRVHEDLSPLTDGQPYAGIPTLAEADPDAFGICLTTAGGSSYEVGDSRAEFTIQSISKPFTYGLALSEQGGRWWMRGSTWSPPGRPSTRSPWPPTPDARPTR